MTERIQHVMVVTAHPDDSEFGAGGTVAALTREGKSVTYCILTNGNKGSSDRGMTPERLVKIREEEQRNAARVLGVETIDFLGFPDCELENTRETRLAVTGAIRRHRPDLIICQNPNRTKNFGVSHRDHRVAADIVLDCVYPLARDHMAFPELLAQGLEPHKVKEVHTMWWDDRGRHLGDHRPQDQGSPVSCQPDEGRGGHGEARPRAQCRARQGQGLCLRRDLRSRRDRSLAGADAKAGSN